MPGSIGHSATPIAWHSQSRPTWKTRSFTGESQIFAPGSTCSIPTKGPAIFSNSRMRASRLEAEAISFADKLQHKPSLALAL